MSSYPGQSGGQPQTHYYQAPQSNGLGVAGFVVSLSGLIVCMGLICPIGLVLSLIALTKAPRGFAIAGCVIGGLGSILAALTILMITGALGAGLMLGSLFGNFQTSMTIDSASYDIDNHFVNNNDTLPDEPTGTAMISSYLDEWGNTLKYEPTQGSTTDYTITSAGPDGKFATSDDMTQYYTAYNWNAPTVTTESDDNVDQESIETAFNFAAKQMVKSFPPDSALPTAEQVSQEAGNLLDPWSNAMRYSPTDNPPYYRLESSGPDEQWGTSDDLTRSFYFAPAGETDGPL